jgi:hypothetical protein
MTGRATSCSEVDRGRESLGSKGGAAPGPPSRGGDSSPKCAKDGPIGENSSPSAPSVPPGVSQLPYAPMPGVPP